MTCRASGHHTQRAHASASAAFAIEMWRAVMVLLVTDRTRLSVPLDIFLLTSGYTSLLWKVVSDASPWRLAAGLYDTCPGAFFAGQLYYCFFRRRIRIASKRNENTSFTVSALDRSLQDLFSRSPRYGHTNGLTTILVLLPGSMLSSAVL